MKLFLTISFLISSYIVLCQSDREFLFENGGKSPGELKALRQTILNSTEKEAKKQLKLKFIDFSLKSKPEQVIERFELLIQISQNTEEENEEFATWAHYHLGSNLAFYELYDLAIQENERCLELAEKNNNEWMKSLVYTNQATVYFRLRDYPKAIKYYSLCGKTKHQWPTYFFASNFNNLGLCQHLSKNYWQAVDYYQKGLQLLENNGRVSPGVNEDVYYLISGNLGSSYIRVGEYELALTYLSKELDYYKRKGIYGFNRTTCLIDFVRLYHRTGNTQKVEPYINEALRSIPKLQLVKERVECIEKLIKVISEEKIYFDKNRINELYNKALLETNIQNGTIQRELTKLLYEDKIQSLEQNAEYAKNNLELEKKNKNLAFFGGITAVTLLVLIVFLVLRNNKRKLQQTELALLVQKQKEEITQNQQIILEQQLINQKQQLNSMFTNLSIKQRTESGFLEKIKELKRDKNASPDMIFKELQLALNNLLDIDKKLITETQHHVDISKELYEKIKERHPELSTNELIMCTYFISDLSAKEIGLLMNLSDVSVRVAKNKIKNKIGLDKDANLDDYLKSISI
jgi:tetratricopeptide (TPR) repeat protein